jgi:hypothetical protein
LPPRKSWISPGDAFPWERKPQSVIKSNLSMICICMFTGVAKPTLPESLIEPRAEYIAPPEAAQAVADQDSRRLRGLGKVDSREHSGGMSKSPHARASGEQQRALGPTNRARDRQSLAVLAYVKLSFQVGCRSSPPEYSVPSDAFTIVETFGAASCPGIACEVAFAPSMTT